MTLDRPTAPGSPTPEESVARGREARSAVPRSSHGEWTPRDDRSDPVDLLERQAAQRIAELIPLRHGRMLASPFAFYRGAALMMASDLGAEPHSGLTVQLCGDAHLSNFGVFAAPDRRLVFSLNDFDETLPGPFEWDVKRLVASFTVAAQTRGFSAGETTRIAMLAASSYRQAMAEFATMRPIDVWYSRVEIDDVISRHGKDVGDKIRKSFLRAVSKAQSRTSLRAFDRLTHLVDGEPRFIGDPPVVVPVETFVPEDRLGEIDDALDAIFASYGESLQADRRHLLASYRCVHAARKVVGVGSVGTRAWMLLLVGRTIDDPLILQFKEAQASVLEEFLGASEYATHGERVVAGQRLMQASSDILLGWHRGIGLDGVERHFFVRQLWDGKGSADVEAMIPEGMQAYARLCGWTLARAHARSGDPIAITSYLGRSDRFDRSMSAFGDAYAEQNDRDYETVRAAVASGRLDAVAPEEG